MADGIRVDRKWFKRPFRARIPAAFAHLKDGILEAMDQAELHDRRDLEALVRSKELSLADLYHGVDKFKAKAWEPENRNNALAEILDYLDHDTVLAKSTIKGKKQIANRMLRDHPKALVTDLPAVLMERRAVLEKKAAQVKREVRAEHGRIRVSYGREFEQYKDLVSGFINKSNKVPGGRHSQLYRDCTGVPDLKRHKIERNPLSPDEARQLAMTCEQIEEGVGPMVWSCCTAGLVETEYYGEDDGVPYEGIERPWVVLEDRIAIWGTKTEHRQRAIPLVYHTAAPVVRLERFRAVVHQAVEQLGWKDKMGRPKLIVLRDFRRTYCGFMKNAGLPLDRIKDYQGHESLTTAVETGGKPLGVTGLYMKGDNQYVIDAEKLRAFIGPDPKFPRRIHPKVAGSVVELKQRKRGAK